MDFLPTFVRLAGSKEPDDRIIDGLDLGPMLRGEAPSPRETFLYYHCKRLEAVRVGQWKLWLCRGEEAVCELYDLKADTGETTNLAEAKPDIVAQLRAVAADARADMGDVATGETGANTRPLARVENPDTLTHYDESHPYIVAMYDLNQRG
jgi:arylsulfatase A-like enzyme